MKILGIPTFVFTFLMCISLREDALGKGKYVFGGTDRPWVDSWSKDAKESITLVEGWKTDLKVRLIDTKSGSIKAIEADTTENLAPGSLDRGGTIVGGVDIGYIYRAQLTSQDLLLKMTDGDRNTTYSVHRSDRPTSPAIWFNLGGQFMVTRIRFYPKIIKEGPDPSRFPKGYEFSNNFLNDFTLSVHDGNPEGRDAAGWLLFKRILYQLENRNPVVEVKLEPPLPVQIVQLEVISTVKAWEIAEFEIFAKGFVPAATFVSDIIDLGDICAWGEIRWEGTPPKPRSGAKVLISTRTGTDNDPNIYFRKTGTADEETPYNDDGTLVDKAFYLDTGRLPTPARGHVGYDYEHWSPWSGPYPFEEGRAFITSPGPRRFIQIRVDFINTSDDGGSISKIEFDYSRPPSVTELSAEIEPIEVKPARNTLFTYAVKPTFGPKDTGFNSLQIKTPVQINPDQIKVVTVGGVKIDLGQFPPDTTISPPSLIVHFPKIGRDQTGKVVKVEFESMVLRFGTSFDGSVFDSETDEVKQRAVPGDADPDLASSSLSVRTILGGSLIAAVKSFPKIITPDGDGLNDELKVSFDLLQLTSPVPVSLRIYNFSGILIRTVYSPGKTTLLSGQYSINWDGKDKEGSLVLPGLYIYQILVEADRGKEMKLGTVGVAY